MCWGTKPRAMRTSRSGKLVERVPTRRVPGPLARMITAEAVLQAERLHILAQSRIAREDVAEAPRYIWAFVVEPDEVDLQRLHLRPERLVDERK
jgi:hypothetical protein